MKLTRRPNLTKEEKKWIDENAKDFTIKQMAKEVKCPYQTIRTYCTRERLPYIRTKAWSRPEKQIAESEFFSFTLYPNGVI